VHILTNYSIPFLTLPTTSLRNLYSLDENAANRSFFFAHCKRLFVRPPNGAEA
jgi:hypothetical protein